MSTLETFNVSDNTNIQPVENVGVTASSVWNQNAVSDWRTASSAGRPETATGLPDFGIDFGTSNDSNTTNTPYDGSASGIENPTTLINSDRTSQSDDRTSGSVDWNSQDRDEKPSAGPENAPMKQPLRDAPPVMDVPSCTPPEQLDRSASWEQMTNALSDFLDYRSCLGRREEGIRRYNEERAEDDRNWANGEGRYAR